MSCLVLTEPLVRAVQSQGNKANHSGFSGALLPLNDEHNNPQSGEKPHPAITMISFLLYPNVNELHSIFAFKAL